MTDLLEGFSKLPVQEKRQRMADLTSNPHLFLADLEAHLHPEAKTQSHYQDFAENTISNYFLPFAVAPNFYINDQLYHIPMVIEESSVVAAASSAAKFWASHGGFKTQVINNHKVGQVHFRWFGDPDRLQAFFNSTKATLLAAVKPLTSSMEKRGGGVVNISLRNKTEQIPGYFQLHLTFRTANAMGANFINSVLEKTAQSWASAIAANGQFEEQERSCEIIMSILSNYTPECLVECKVNCPVSALEKMDDRLTGEAFARKFKLAVDIANSDIYRATTHNKGIYNGIDAVVLATGNDFRAVEACGHAFASASGQYKSLNEVNIYNDSFEYTLRVPMALGTVGGITNLHPMVKWTLDILRNPSAEELMMIAASVGMANNFSAVKSLITTGIQHGHMRMHLSNILNSLHATKHEKQLLLNQFRDQTVSYSQVKQALLELRKSQP